MMIVSTNIQVYKILCLTSTYNIHNIICLYQNQCSYNISTFHVGIKHIIIILKFTYYVYLSRKIQIRRSGVSITYSIKKKKINNYFLNNNIKYFIVLRIIVFTIYTRT